MQQYQGINTISYPSLCLTLAAILLLGKPLPSSAMVLVQDGFEDASLGSWHQGAGTLDFAHDEFWTVASSKSHGGAYAATNVGNNELRRNFAPLAAASVTEVSLFLLNQTVCVEFAIQLHYHDGSSEQLLVQNPQVDVWHRFDVAGALDTARLFSGISFFGVRSSDPGGIRLYRDDVTVVAAPCRYHSDCLSPHVCPC